MEQVITISGKARSGKDSLGEALRIEFEKLGKRVCVVHYADYLKMIARNYYGWDGNKDEKGRTILQHLGTNVARQVNPDIWVDVVMMFILAFRYEFDVFIIPDTRFPNEVLTPKLSLPNMFTSINVRRPDAPQTLTPEQSQHPSETALDDFGKFDFDISITEGLENVKVMAKLLVKNILSRKREEKKRDERKVQSRLMGMV